MAIGYWRDSARDPKFYLVNAGATLPMLVFLLHIRLWTFMVAILATIFFTILARYGFTITVFFRWFRNFLGGSRKRAVPWWR